MTSRGPASTEVVHDLDAIEKTAPPRFQRFEAWLTRYSISLLRISLGLIILGFGVLKHFPGVSPAESLVKATVHLMTFGLVPAMGRIAMVGTATLECFIGISLILRRGLRATIYLLFPVRFWEYSPRSCCFPTDCSPARTMPRRWKASTSSKTSSFSPPVW